MIFGDFLNILPENLSTRPLGYSDLQTASNLDVLFQKVSRTKAVSQNRLLDFLSPESDKHFLRSKQIDKLNLLASKLSVSSQLITMVETQAFVARITPYFPENMRWVLRNFQGLLDSSARMIQDVIAGSTYSALANALFVDLMYQYGEGNATFNQLLTISQKVTDYFIYGLPTKNNLIRSLLSLGLDQFLPANWTTGLFDALQYTDLLDSIFGGDNYANTFTNRIDFLLNGYAKKKVAGAVANQEPFLNATIGIADPFGLGLELNFTTQLNEDFNTFFEETVLRDPVIVQAALTDEQKIELQDYVAGFYAETLQTACGVGITLPSAAAVIQGIEVEAKNSMIREIQNTFTKVFRHILLSLEVTVDDTVAPFDYLQNIKRNIEERNKLKQTGMFNTKLKEVDAYFTKLFGRRYKDSEIDELSKKVNEILS